MAVLRVILFLLKLLGILILALLGLVLLVILLALLAPVRYKGKVKKQEEPENAFFADALVSWLNPVVRARIFFREGKLKYTVRLFGFCLSNSEKKKKKQQKEKKQKKDKKNRKKKRGRKKEESPEEISLLTEKSDMGEGSGSEVSVEHLPAEEREETAEQPEKEKDGSGKKDSVFTKLKKFLERVRALPLRIKEKIQHICAQIKFLWRKKEAASTFFKEEVHVTVIGRAMGALKKLFAHILPGKLKGSVEFGTGDPESTGKALGALGILYAAYGKGITIVPYFNEKRMVANLTFRGRIRLGTLLVILLRLIRDKQARDFYKDWKQLMSLLKEKAE